MTTQATNDEILDTFTEYRRRHLPLDELQALIEAHLGLPLERVDLTDGEIYSSGKLVAKSPTGILLFSIMVYQSEGRGWQVGGHGDFLGDSWNTLLDFHKVSVEVTWVRREGQVVTVRRFEDGHVEEKVSK